jgi:hypothetical protein
MTSRVDYASPSKPMTGILPVALARLTSTVPVAGVKPPCTRGPHMAVPRPSPKARRSRLRRQRLALGLRQETGRGKAHDVDQRDRVFNTPRLIAWTGPPISGWLTSEAGGFSQAA